MFLFNFRVIYTKRMLTKETVKEIWEFRCAGNLCRALAIIYRKCHVFILGALTTNRLIRESQAEIKLEEWRKYAQRDKR